MTVLVTGAAGFIGFHVSMALLKQGVRVAGIDNLNSYYDPALKKIRLSRLQENEQFTFEQIDIADRDGIERLGKSLRPDAIVHLAAQAGVRHSLKAPFQYTDSNITGMLSLLEMARNLNVQHMVYASSSSVYGRNSAVPFNETQSADAPASLYGATKRANELMASSYGHLYSIPLTGLRFFTVYGPWGRPDMAYWLFTDKILRNEPIQIFNQGKMGRDFTYIDDIVEGILAALAKPPSKSDSYHRVFNLGNDHPEELMTLVTTIEKLVGRSADKKMMGMQPGDVEQTWANISQARAILGYQPKTALADGLSRFVEWFASYAKK